MGTSSSILTGPNQLRSKNYDYIIVGGGTAGCVLAARLSEDSSVKVLLVEAGSRYEDAFLARIPLAVVKLFKSAYDWAFDTTAQPGLDGRAVFFPRGKLLGGTSSINVQLFHHCAPQDFDEWERLGAAGWSYQELHPYMLKLEKHIGGATPPGLDASQRGNAGQYTTWYPQRTDIAEIVTQACVNMGAEYNPDFNTPRGTLGVGHFPGSISASGERCSAATAYLTPAVLSRSNLTIVTGTTVSRVLLDDTGSRAIGVEVLPTVAKRSATPHVILAKNEVILSGGSVATPQILMLSGLGPAAELEKHGIPVIKDLPAVGRNLKDHLSPGGVVLRALPHAETLDWVLSPFGALYAIARWMWNGTGPMTGLGMGSAIFFRCDDTKIDYGTQTLEDVKDTTSGSAAPDMEILWANLVVLDKGFGSAPRGVKGISVGGVVLRPLSTGTVTLRSANVFDAPLIDPRYLEDKNDMRVALRILRFTLQLAHTEPLRSFLDFAPRRDGCEFFELYDRPPEDVSDDELRAYVRRNAQTVYHPTSTARMGTNVATSVVDLRLRVHGIAGLRIVDASVFPTIVSGHPVVPVLAVAEKAAEIIRADNA